MGGPSSHNRHYVVRPRVAGRGGAAFLAALSAVLILSQQPGSSRPDGLRLKALMPARLHRAAAARSRSFLLVPASSAYAPAPVCVVM